MAALTKEFSVLGARDAFNQTLRHLVNVTSLVGDVEKGLNLADLLHGLLEQGTITRDQVTPIVSLILLNRLKAPYRSLNMKETISSFDRVVETMKRWNGVDVTLVYHQPNVGAATINPANAAHWEAVHDLKKHELLVVYARHSGGKPDVAERALHAFIDLLEGGSPAEEPDFVDQRKLQMARAAQEAAERARQAAEQRAAEQARAAAAAPQTAAPAAAPAAPAAAPAQAPAAGGQMQLTPKYSVQVTNELFHNGNVEAWKNIIESYIVVYPQCKVIVYHEGELIQDLNSLFKWGKVKHGGIIFFQVAGPVIKGVSRLQKYLHEGASSRYETFMKHDINKALSLF